MQARANTRQIVICVALGSIANALGCQSDAKPAVAPTNAASFCSALAVIKENCQQCHGAALNWGAPMSLLSFADLQAPAPTDHSKHVFEMMSLRIHDAKRPMPQPPAVLSADALATLDSWIAGGAQPGADPTCMAGAAGTGAAGTGTAGTSSAAGSGAAGDATAAGSGAIGTAGTNAAAGTGATAGSGGTAGTAGTAGTGGSAGTGDIMPVDEWPADCQDHYTFLANNGSAGGKYSVAAGKESHPQFYFDVPWGNDPVQALYFKPITDNMKILHHWILYSAGDAHLSGWAPGKTNPPLPADVGLYMPSASDGKLRLDVHYNNTSAAAVPELDASGVEVCITHKFRPQTAAIVGLRATVNVPAHMMVDNTGTCTAQVTGGPVHIVNVSPHMHKLGVHAYLSWKPSGGSAQVLHDAAYSFDDQRVYTLDNVIVKNGDTLTTTCSYDNTTDTSVRFGQSTSDEMCFNWITYYPMNAFGCLGGIGL